MKHKNTAMLNETNIETGNSPRSLVTERGDDVALHDNCVFCGRIDTFRLNADNDGWEGGVFGVKYLYLRHFLRVLLRISACFE